MYKNDHQLDDFFGLSPESQSEQPKERIKDAITKRSSFWTRIRMAPKVLSTKERYVVFSLFIIILGSLIAIPFTAYYHYTEAKPDFGGTFSEGILGEPQFINPLLSQGNNDADRDLVALIYSGLMKYDGSGKLIPDLAKSYEISSDGLNYTVYLRDNALWHDGERVTADDVIYTIQTAQNPDYGSPHRINWSGIDIERVNEFAIMFKLKNKYAQFLNNLTIGILPRHIWQDVKPISFSTFKSNLEPVGSGPYLLDKQKKDSQTGRIISFKFKSFEKYFDGRPFINNVEIKFYQSEDAMIEAYNRNEISDLGFISPANIKKLKFSGRLNINKLELPRYFAVFFNQNRSKVLSDKNVREALARSTDKKELIQKILENNGTAVDSPLMGEMLGLADDYKKFGFDIGAANKILDENGWAKTDENGIRINKDKEKLLIKITTSTRSEFVQAADILKQQWAKTGIQADIETLPISQLQQAIKDRAYESLLFGAIVQMDPDPYTVWHSSQKRDPGLNLALYDSKEADTLLEEARQALNPLERTEKYNSFQRLVAQEIPAIFLYSSYALYSQSKNIKGFDTKIIALPSDRFNNIARWYIDTQRVFK